MLRAPALVALAAAAATWGLAACAPALNWREVRLHGPGVVALLPCRPDVHVRRVRLAGMEVDLTLHSCTANDVTWALAVADLADAALTPRAVRELREAAAANVAAGPPRSLPFVIEGATLPGGAGRLALEGRRPDGAVVQEQLAVFARGTHVVQATALGRQLPDDAADMFFGALRVAP